MYLNDNSSKSPKFRIGLNGNYYVYCDIREPLVEITGQIGKSANSIYYNKKYEIWAIRVKQNIHKILLKKLFTL